MSKEKRRVPKLRFPGFTEDWEQRKLGDVAIITGGGTPSTNVPEYWNGDIDWYSPVEIGKNRYVSKSTRKITKLGLEKSSAKLLPIGTVLFTSRAGIGNTAILQAEGCTNQGFQSITPDSKELDTYFLYTMTPRLKRYGEVTGAGSTFVEVSGKQMEKMSLVLPSLEEQKQIGRFFRTIDDSITLHQRKLNNLKLKKKALLQKLFPKNEERYPELRFPGFTDAWEQRKLSEVTTCFDNLRVPVTASDRVPGKIPYYGANGIQDYVSGHTHSGEFVLIAEDGANDLNDYPIQYVNGAIWVNNHAHVIAGYKEKLENKFLSYSLKTVKMTTFIVGGGRSKLNLKALLEIPISMPNYDEQCVIGKFIETIDINITLHQRKLDHLQLQKKALLQQMFV